MVPKLVAEDIPLLHSLLSDVFPGVAYTPAQMLELRRELRKMCSEMYLTYGENDEQGTQWVEKVTVQNYFHYLANMCYSNLFYSKRNNDFLMFVKVLFCKK